MYESTSVNWIRKIALQKKGSTTIPIRNVFVSVYTHINKKIIKDVSNSTGIVNSFSTFSNTGNVISFNFTNVDDRSNSRPDFFHIIQYYYTL